MKKLQIKNNITLEQVIKSNPETIYYSPGSNWWTHDLRDCKIVSGSPDVRDPLGLVLFTAHPKIFFTDRLSNPTQYGFWQLQAFMSAHAKNCFDESGTKQDSSVFWKPYNDALTKIKTDTGKQLDLIGEYETAKKFIGDKIKSAF